MDANLLASLGAAIRDVQTLTNEDIVFGSSPIVPCTAGSTLSTEFLFEPGGASGDLKISVCVLKTDLAAAPEEDSYVTFRGSSMRVQYTEDLVLQWHIHLIQQLA